MDEDASIRKILMDSRRIAVVGLSDDEEKPSYIVADYLQKNGFEIIAVNPKLLEWHGKYAYESLEKIPLAVDVAVIFRKPEFVLDIVISAIKIRAKAVWVQEGIANQEAAKLALEAGLLVVMDKCIMKEHMRLYNRRR